VEKNQNKNENEKINKPHIQQSTRLQKLVNGLVKSQQRYSTFTADFVSTTETVITDTQSDWLHRQLNNNRTVQ